MPSTSITPFVVLIVPTTLSDTVLIIDIIGLPKFDTNNRGSSNDIFMGLSITAISFTT